MARSPVVVLTGARQTGKTTLARDILGRGRVYRTLDDMASLEQAQREPDSLVSARQPVTVDEIQRSPDLLLAIKRRVDERRSPGQFLLTGSANLALLARVSETLAGRAVYKTLMPLTGSELAGAGGCGRWSELVQNAEPLESKAAEKHDWAGAILAGGLPPAALSTGAAARTEWFDGYVRTYLERDLQQLASIDNLPDFRRLLRIAALRTGRIVNQSDMARDAGLSQPTAHRYLNLLEASHLLFRLPAYAVNRTKRLIKAPRLFLADPGLACFLAGIHTALQLKASDMFGFLLENLVLGDLLAWRETQTPAPEILYWRTTSGTEVDFVIEHRGMLVAVEVKATAQPRLDHARGLIAFSEEYRKTCRFGILLHTGRDASRLAKSVWSIPLASALGLGMRR